MPDFSGFKSTTLVGSQDLTLGSSVKKSPIGRRPIHEYAVQPVVASTSQLNLEDQVITTINAIIVNTQYENYSEDLSIDTIKQKVIPTVIELGYPELAEPIEI